MRKFFRTESTIERPLPPPWPPTYSVGLSVHASLRKVERLDVEIAASGLDPELARKVLREALARNAHGTASIEGNPLSLQDVESLLARGPTPEAVEEPDEREILNWHAWMEGLADQTFPTTVAGVAEVHRQLFDGVLDDAGQLKETHNFVGRKSGEVEYIPTAPEDVEAELLASLQWLLEGDEHPVIKGLLWFHEFQAIHPFRDGNGRSGRALLTLWLHSNGLAGIRYAHVDATFNADRPPYYEALRAAEQGTPWDRTPWLDYMAHVLVETFEDAAERAAFVHRLPTHLNERQRDLARWWRRMDRAKPGRRLKIADIHAAHPATPRRTLQMDLRLLVDEGILEKEGMRKGTTYRAAGPQRDAA